MSVANGDNGNGNGGRISRRRNGTKIMDMSEGIGGRNKKKTV